MRLLNKGENTNLLSMTATPIPRTLALSIYGDLDVSQITELPPGRVPITTKIISEDDLTNLFKIVEDEINKGKQAYVILPLIEDSEKMNLSSAKKTFKHLSEEVFFNKKVGLLHGKLSSQEKNEVINSFLKNEINILVSTTVIEVGIDVPNATIMIIYNSDRFGLSQLHQLRGRVGRGQKQGVCILLFKEGLSKSAIKRIKILKNSDDGFFIAEEDLKLRGFGDLIGYQQSGIKNFRFADPIHHEDLFRLAEKYILDIRDSINEKKYSFLLKLFDKAEIINIEEF